MGHGVQAMGRGAAWVNIQKGVDVGCCLKLGFLETLAEDWQLGDDPLLDVDGGLLLVKCQSFVEQAMKDEKCMVSARMANGKSKASPVFTVIQKTMYMVILTKCSETHHLLSPS